MTLSPETPATTSRIEEATKGVHSFLDGRHQVVHLGKVGDFHLFSAAPVYDESREVAAKHTELHGDAFREHLKKIHTLDEYQAGHRAKSAWWQDATDRGEVDDTGFPTAQPPNFFVHDNHLLGDGATHLRLAAHEATQRLRDAGLPSQTRHTVVADLSKMPNHNTGESEGDVGGYWSRKDHLIALSRDPAHFSSTSAKAGVLVHEWAHAFHDEMPKDQKSAWKNFYQRSVVSTTIPPLTEQDKDRLITHFADTFASHPNIKALNRQIQARRNASNPYADMMESVYRSEPHWWEAMLKHEGHNGIRHMDIGVVAQISHKREALDEEGNKSTIRKGAYVHVRRVDPDHPGDWRRMQREFFSSEDAPNLLAVSPVDRPEQVHLISHHNLVFHPQEVKSGEKVRTHLLVSPEKTNAYAPFLRERYHRRAARAVRDQGEAARHFKMADEARTSNFKKQNFPMSEEWKTGGELGGSEHRTPEAYAMHLKRRGGNSVDVAFDESLSKSLKHMEIAYPNLRKLYSVENASLTPAQRILDSVAHGTKPEDAAANLVRYSGMDYTPADFVGRHHKLDRETAHTLKRAFTPYGASNDRELFATTAEHVADLRRKPFVSLHPHQQRLVRSWQSMIAGEPLTENVKIVALLAANIDRYLGS